MSSTSGTSVRWPRVALFYVLTLALTVAATGAFRAAGGSWQGPSGAFALNLVMLVPGLVALALQRFVFREPLQETLALHGARPRWLVTAWLLAAAIMLLTLAVGLLLPGSSFSPGMTGLATLGMSPDDVATMRARLPACSGAALAALLVQGLLLGPTACLVGALGEELGWRGFLFSELRALEFGSRSRLTGLLWGVWHLPLVCQGYAYPAHPWVGALLLLGLLQALAPLYDRLRERTHSILVPAVFHGTCSASSVVAVAFVGGGSELLTGFTGLAGLCVTAAVCAGFLRVSSH